MHALHSNKDRDTLLIEYMRDVFTDTAPISQHLFDFVL